MRWLAAARLAAVLSTATVADPVIGAITSLGWSSPRTLVGVPLALVVAACTASVCWVSIPPPQRAAAPVALGGVVIGSIALTPVLTDRWLYTAPFFLLSGLLLSLRGPARPAAAAAVFAGVFVAARVQGHDLPRTGEFALMLAGFAVVLTGVIGVLRVYVDLHTAQDDVRRLAGDAERLRLAAELHDSLSHDLVRIALNCDVAAARLPAEADGDVRSALAAASADARDALRGVREVINGDQRADIHDELRAGAGLLHARGIEMVLLGQPPAGVEVLRWVVREGLTNVVKHSVGAHLCQIRFANTASHHEVRIEDNGTGGSVPSEGAGLTGLRRRVESAGGSLDFGSRRSGTTLTVRLPA
ncbi:two-component system sensor histidine kinase DesK [Amycolatopsis lexingtonensis]|uniref:Two-component system sensor histidine kinase DesK n=1 Tax=Amycolatopsis lexingtonensis TaxID=218822 RepID=A0ABR9HQD8_9PSEU|nr:histidine kinase [Amycolatopsis lexingtonensis]MBE1493139.1 two-component system sensor histidine kinase DesK [Amycolatopsis lexingtonensis]